jgi:hypothetical protein
MFSLVFEFYKGKHKKGKMGFVYIYIWKQNRKSIVRSHWQYSPLEKGKNQGEPPTLV